MKDSKPNQMEVKVTHDTPLRKGDEKVFLFQIQGSSVAVTFSENNGEKMAQSVVTKGR